MLIIILTPSTSWGCHDDQMRWNRSKSALKSILTPQMHGGDAWCIVVIMAVVVLLLQDDLSLRIFLMHHREWKEGGLSSPRDVCITLKGVCRLKNVNNLFLQGWFSLHRNKQLLPPFSPNTHNFLSPWEIQVLYLYNHFAIPGAC